MVRSLAYRTFQLRPRALPQPGALRGPRDDAGHFRAPALGRRRYPERRLPARVCRDGARGAEREERGLGPRVRG